MSNRVPEQCSYECTQTRKEQESACRELVKPGHAPRMHLKTTLTSREAALTIFYDYLSFKHVPTNWRRDSVWERGLCPRGPFEPPLIRRTIYKTIDINFTHIIPFKHCLKYKNIYISSMLNKILHHYFTYHRELQEP